MGCDLLLLEPIRFMLLTQMHLIDDIVSIHSCISTEIKNKHKMKSKLPIGHTIFSLFKDYNENLLRSNQEFSDSLIRELASKFSDEGIQDFMVNRIKQQLEKLAEMNEQQQYTELISELEDESLEKLSKNAEGYFSTFFPKSDIIRKFRNFYSSKCELVKVERKEFKANLPISTRSLIDKCC